MKTLHQSSVVLQTHVTKLDRPLRIAGGYFESVGDFRGGSHLHFSVTVWLGRKRFRVNSSAGEGFNSNSRVILGNGDGAHRFSILGSTHLRIIGSVKIVPAHVIAYKNSINPDSCSDDEDQDQSKYGEIRLLTNTRVVLLRNNRNTAKKTT